LTGRIVTYPAAYDPGLILCSRTQHRGYVVAARSGELGLASAPALREQLANLAHIRRTAEYPEMSAASGLSLRV
jgi:hypothetical protein